MATEPRRSARTRKGLRKKLAGAPVRGEYALGVEETTFVKQTVIKQIRALRSRLGREMFNLYEHLEPLRIKHFELNKVWTVDELADASERVLRLTKVVAVVKKKLDAITAAAGFARVNEKRMREASVDMNRALRFLLRITPSAELREMLGEGRDAAQVYFMDNFNKGVGMLRFAWSKLFYVTAAEPLVMTLSDAESYIWYRALEEGNKPPVRMIEEFEAYANERGVPVEVYDHEGNWIWSQPPFQHLGERPLALAIALKEPRRARQRWGYRRVEASTGRALAEQLSPQEQKLVQDFLERNQGRSFTLDEIATYAGVGIRDVKPEGGATPNASGKTALDDLALHRAVMLMDLEAAGSMLTPNGRKKITFRLMAWDGNFRTKNMSRASGREHRESTDVHAIEKAAQDFMGSYEPKSDDAFVLIEAHDRNGYAVGHNAKWEGEDGRWATVSYMPEQWFSAAERRRRARSNGSGLSVAPLNREVVLDRLEQAAELAYSPRAFPPGRTLEARNIIGHLWTDAHDAGNTKLASALAKLDDVPDSKLSAAISGLVEVIAGSGP